jgi:HD-GYP domain-containing protein (c-di-GMP phosphodiesterase class II)
MSWKNAGSLTLENAEGLEGAESLTLGSLLASLSRALDLTEGQAMGHSVVACLIALRIADAIGLSAEERADLHLAMLLKDAGCSSNATRMFEIFGGDETAAKRDVKTCNWCSPLAGIGFALQHAAPHLGVGARIRQLFQITQTPGNVMQTLTQIRCERGANIVRLLGLGERVAETVYSLDEHWNGLGSPEGLRKTNIPLLSRIACLAQTVAVFHMHVDKNHALRVAKKRTKTWFDPQLVTALFSFADDTKFWQYVKTHPNEVLHTLTQDRLSQPLLQIDINQICLAFAAIVDAKSPYTANHSRRVADYAVHIAKKLGLSATIQTQIWQAGLLHDLGKLGVPSAILEKPDRLTPEEWTIIRKHPDWTGNVLQDVPALVRVRAIAVAHHEKLDGTGYGQGLLARDLDTPMRVLAIADIWDALTADRPYRAGMSHEDALAILQKDAGTALDADGIAMLKESPLILQHAA